jgi:hypothetical protein
MKAGGGARYRRGGGAGGMMPMKRVGSPASGIGTSSYIRMRQPGGGRSPAESLRRRRRASNTYMPSG